MKEKCAEVKQAAVFRDLHLVSETPAVKRPTAFRVLLKFQTRRFRGLPFHEMTSLEGQGS